MHCINVHLYFDLSLIILSMGVTKEVFGKIKNPKTGKETEAFRYTLSSAKGVIIKVLSIGATLSSVELPDRNGRSNHVVLGFDSVDDYVKKNYIGNTIGRFANRIKSGKFELGGKSYQLTVNNNGNHLHGGETGWDKVSYSLEEDGGLHIDFQAMSSNPTPINLTNHAFFNLAGHDKGQKGLFEHDFQVLADSYLPVTNDSIPTGVIEPVSGTPFDLRKTRNAQDVMSKAPNEGYDHCFCFTTKKRGELGLAAVFSHPPSGRKLEVFTTEPGLQVYTGNFMPKDSKEMVGRGNIPYTYQGAFCLEPQNYPDAVNKDL
ncbi:Aldose 1-epimerase [Armadillidium nasatum]|uniref:Galactose mutarotase n=1 Tax=Armadillidium nasatum TaxID=96803 RepID=A0A5N5T2I5_9CRUS|nr:Aldose 1-epimerase [Armadillidium nasatum]